MILQLFHQLMSSKIVTLQFSQDLQVLKDHKHIQNYKQQDEQGEISTSPKLQQKLTMQKLIELNRSKNKPEMEIIGKINFSKQKGLPKQYLKLVKNMKMSKSSQRCAVCMGQFEKDEIIKKLPCSHIFHRQCAKNWLKINIKCPVCRFDLKQHFSSIVSEEKTEYQES